MKNLCLLGLVLFLAACASTPKKEFEKLKVGMYKGDVLDIMGSPQESRYKGDQYVWTYKFLDETQQVVKEVHVKNDFVTYVGEPVAFTDNKFGKISRGMTKSQVLDVLGFPAKSEKRSGHDVWTYKAKSGSGENSFQVQFEGDKVISSGFPPNGATVPPTPETFEKIE